MIGWLLAVVLAQTLVPVRAEWTAPPEDADPAFSWQLERDGAVYACGDVTRITDGLRCTAMVPAGTAVFRLRGAAVAGVTAWSDPVTATVAPPTEGPGAFTITTVTLHPARPGA